GRKKISRQIRRLIRRLTGGAYLRIWQNRRLFNAATLCVAYDRFLLGLSYRRIEQKRGLSRRQVQTIVRRLQGWLDGCGQTGITTGPAGMSTSPAKQRARPQRTTGGGP
ncbi:MAG: hypothetical protein JW810_14540, partial [Sedimentisphaerales bacterium]|nr:hypothetical protein [Sedimentisphaerales bacterium]